MTYHSAARLRGIALRLAIGALFLSLMRRGIERFADETSVWDPMVLAIIAVMVGIVAAAAVLVPLRRVQRLSPQELLRGD